MVAVAVSGGRDSMALLHCTARSAQAFGIEPIALHVHHGLMPQADAWAEQVRATCHRWKIRFAMQRLAGKPTKGDSIEAWARTQRYAALTAMADACRASLVLLAHHQRDQAETFLLQAMRGSGPAGLAAMPRLALRNGIVWARPWLAMPRQTVEAYVRRHRIACVDDPSNADLRFARSHLRAVAMPALRAAFPSIDEALASAAAHSAQAQAVLDEVAQHDVAKVAEGNSLRIAAWSLLTPARRVNVLRHWLRLQAGRGAPESLVTRLLDELPRSGEACWPFCEQTLRRHRGRLQLGPEAPAALHDDLQARGQAGLQITPVSQGGVAADDLQGAEWRQRMGGERFQRHAGTPARSLKKQFQGADVPAWLRDVPLLYAADGRLLFVPGLGTDARALAAAGQPQCALTWRA